MMEICALLSETDCTFQVRGFGAHWPVDVRYDLSTVMEQLPDLISAIRNGSVGHLDFYGQGLERVLDFSPVDRRTIITCVSGTDFEPPLERENLDTESLVAMLVDTATRFAHAASQVAPSITMTEPIGTWIRENRE
ncbi:hypothetical protein [Streptomyces phytohabitans]|uniref:hypothetical protein n=1 Tax=Streptomyces phytohabitans TaxID=1150371 RepID=UPI00345C2B37